MILLAGFGVHGIERYVIMDMPLIHMGSEDNFIFGQMFLNKPYAQLMGQLRGDLTRREALNNMEGLDAFCFVEKHLGLMPSLSSILGVTIPEVGEHGIVGLIRVLNVADQLIKAHVLGQDLGYRHVFSQSRMR